jgi:hypothetical protein
MTKSPATKTPHKDMHTLEPRNARQGNRVVEKMGGPDKTRADMDKVAQHIEKLENMWLCA